MAKIKRETEENIEDVERISNILNRRNPYLRAMKVKRGFSLIEKFPVYGSKKKRKKKR